MKKTLLAAVIALMPLSANAQYYYNDSFSDDNRYQQQQATDSLRYQQQQLQQQMRDNEQRNREWGCSVSRGRFC
jgi:hypothetical protein